MNDDRLISLNAAIDALEKVADLFPWKVLGNRDSYDRYNEAWNDAIGRAEIEIEKLPSAQPDIVACGDCIHWICHDRRCGYWNHGVKPLDWCCHAERRSDG